MRRLVRRIATMAVVAVTTTVGAPVFAQEPSLFEDRVSALFFGEIDYRERQAQQGDGFVLGQGVG